MTKRAETMLGRKWLGLLALLGLSMIGAPFFLWLLLKMRRELA